jgi:opacity protein-like surface antigen
MHVRIFRIFGFSVLALWTALLLPDPAAFAHPHELVVYASGQAGVSLPVLTNVNWVNSWTTGATTEKFDLSESPLYGFKLGMYQTNTLFGFETEVFQTHPHLKQQTVLVRDPVFGNSLDRMEGKNGRLTTWAFNVIARLPVSERVQVYAGAGPAIFFSRYKAVGQFTQTSTRPGLNTQLGVNYFLTPNISLFGEWKFNRTRFHYNTAGDLSAQHAAAFNADYTAHNLVFGVTYNWGAPLKGQDVNTWLRELFPSTDR